MPETSPLEQIQTWLRTLRHRDAATREQATHELRQVGTERLFQILVGLLETADAEHRCLIAEAFYRVDAKASVEPLIGLLADAEWGVRVQACGVLHDVGCSSACEDLTRLMLSDPHPMVRNTAAYALGGIGDPRVILPLIGAARNDHEPDELGHTTSNCAATALENILGGLDVIDPGEFRTANRGDQYRQTLIELAVQVERSNSESNES